MSIPDIPLGFGELKEKYCIRSSSFVCTQQRSPECRKQLGNFLYSTQLEK